MLRQSDVDWIGKLGSEEEAKNACLDESLEESCESKKARAKRTDHNAGNRARPERSRLHEQSTCARDVLEPRSYAGWDDV
jgi:hypothetical protein